MARQPLDAAAFRSLFPALERVVYLNTATAPPAARPVLEALRRVESEWERGVFSWQGWESEAEEARALFAALIGVDRSSVALLGSLAEAAATVALTVPDEGRVVVGEGEFRSNLWPWLALRERGCDVVTVASENGLVRTSALVEAVTPGTSLVAVSLVQSSNGYRVDPGPIVRRAHEVGARVFLNATQALGVLGLNARELDADFVGAHGYKWLLAPRGAAWLYVRPELIDTARPLAANWKSAADPYGEYYGNELELAAQASRLDASLAWFSWVGAKAALELILSLDRDEVEAHCLALAAAFRKGAEAAGWDAVQEELPSHVVALSVDDPAELRRSLIQRNVIASVRGGGLRLGFHAFNDPDDVEAALAALGPGS